jgi:hypothetical protein
MVVSQWCWGEGEGWFEDKYLAFKFLLVLDNGPRHQKNTGLTHPHIVAQYLSNTTITSLLQPLNQSSS